MVNFFKLVPYQIFEKEISEKIWYGTDRSYFSGKLQNLITDELHLVTLSTLCHIIIYTRET